MNSQSDACYSQKERTYLLNEARAAIRAHLEGQRPKQNDNNIPQALMEPRGAFVTLHLNRDLRGCIGTFETDRPLIETIRRMAIAAATEDPRFPPVSIEELPRITIEISVLSPRSRIHSPHEIVVGKHGLYVTHGPRRGVLLPQVATEQGWDAETFLAFTCRKAGLPLDKWRDEETILELFSAEIFEESASS